MKHIADELKDLWPENLLVFYDKVMAEGAPDVYTLRREGRNLRPINTPDNFFPAGAVFVHLTTGARYRFDSLASYADRGYYAWLAPFDAYGVTKLSLQSLQLVSLGRTPPDLSHIGKYVVSSSVSRSLSSPEMGRVVGWSIKQNGLMHFLLAKGSEEHVSDKLIYDDYTLLDDVYENPYLSIILENMRILDSRRSNLTFQITFPRSRMRNFQRVNNEWVKTHPVHGHVMKIGSKERGVLTIIEQTLA